jgi:uncharacterized membrane protein
MTGRVVSRQRSAAAFGLIAAGVIVNPWLVAAVATDDGSIGSPLLFAAILFASLSAVLAGLQLLVRWVELLSWGQPVGWIRGVVTIGIVAFAIAGVHWRVATYREAHSHVHLVPTGHDSVSPEQQQWAEDFHKRSLDAALRNGWFDIKNAYAQGFQKDPINRDHHPNRENMFDDVILDPERPEWLIYQDLPDGGKVLVGFMFFTRALMDVGPTPAGPLAQWHYHPYERPRCAIEGLWTVGDPDANGQCAEGVPVTRTPEMFHVWFVDHPLGRFTEMNVVSEYWAEKQPDAHPIVVHFAIALFVIAVFLDFAGLVTRRPGLHAAAWVNLVLGAIAAVAAVATGVTAELLLKPTHEAHQTLDLHKTLAFGSLGGILLLTAWRYALRGQLPRRGLSLYLAAGVASVAAIAGAGYYGGRMVYQHGAGVQALENFARERYWRQVREVYSPSRPTPAAVPATHAGH